MNSMEIKDLLIANNLLLPSNDLNKHAQRKLKNNEELKNIIWSYTSFVENEELNSIRERFFCIMNDITEAVVCSHCGSSIKFSNGKYAKYCSSSCAFNATNENRKQTNLEKFGDTSPMRNQLTIDKIKRTNNIKYGSDWHQLSVDGKKQRTETILSNYGTKCVLASPDVRNKRKQSMIERYGVEHPIQNQIVREKIKATTNERYGVDHICESDEIKEKRKQTNIERYGVEYPLLNEGILNNTRESLFEKYGAQYPGQSKTIRERGIATVLARYGYSTVLSHPKIQEQIKRTNKEKYGVEYYNQQQIVGVMDQLLDYDWLYEQYCVMNKTATQISDELGIDDTTVCNYLRKAEISIRSSIQYSYMSICWLDSICDREGISIQHAMNGGEYKIPGTRYYADGYCKETNTIYEFHGDLFHGNINLFDEGNCCHPFDKTVTAGELYNKTKIKENKIKELGYNLVVMWEFDYVSSLS